MKHMLKGHLGLTVMLVGCWGGVACNSAELEEAQAVADAPASEENTLAVAPPALTDADRAEVERDRAIPSCHESVSARELEVRWEKTSETPLSTLTAIVRNSGSRAMLAEPVLIASNVSLGDARERRLSPVTVPAGAEVTVTVDVAELPVQSIGTATSVALGLRWRRSDMPEAEMQSPQAISAQLFVTHHDESFRTASARDLEAELARQSAARIEAQPARVAHLRAVDRGGTLSLARVDALDAPVADLGTPSALPTADQKGARP